MHSAERQATKPPGTMRGASIPKRNGMKPVKTGLMKEKLLEKNNWIRLGQPVRVI
jgi:hypothetical protein